MSSTVSVAGRLHRQPRHHRRPSPEVAGSGDCDGSAPLRVDRDGVGEVKHAVCATSRNSLGPDQYRASKFTVSFKHIQHPGRMREDVAVGRYHLSRQRENTEFWHLQRLGTTSKPLIQVSRNRALSWPPPWDGAANAAFSRRAAIVRLRCRERAPANRAARRERREKLA